MADTGTSALTVTHLPHGLREYVFAWTSTAGGAVEDNESVEQVADRVLQVETIPSATAAPTADYDVTLEDGNGVDMLQGQGANRSASAAEGVVFDTPTIITTRAMVLKVTNAGNAKSGTVRIIMGPPVYGGA